MQLSTFSSPSNSGTVVLPDEAFEGLRPESQVLNINYPDEKKEISEAALNEEIQTLSFPYNCISKIEMYENNIGLKVIVSYLALYLGVVFLITAAASLALQQLSEASDNIERYRLLRKIGTENSMINRALFTQILIYFADADGARRHTFGSGNYCCKRYHPAIWAARYSFEYIDYSSIYFIDLRRLLLGYLPWKQKYDS